MGLSDAGGRAHKPLLPLGPEGKVIGTSLSTVVYIPTVDDDVRPSLRAAKPGRQSRLKIAKPAIVAFFERSEKRVYSPAELRKIFGIHRYDWQLPRSTTETQFIAFLLAATSLRSVGLQGSAAHSKRYVWGKASPYELALSLRTSAYLSHGTAMFLHGLTEQISTTIYVNQEQSPKPEPSGRLSQESVDLAFSRTQRESTLAYSFDHHKALILSGKHTADLEVGSIAGPEGELLRATKLERTLIDIVVRPVYAGGVYQVLEA
jgi:hypothetical protein